MKQKYSWNWLIHCCLSIDCPICLNSETTDPVTTDCCKKAFCRSCLDKALKYSPYCPTCKKPLRTVTGNQPQGTMNTYVSQMHLPGYPKCGTITINYHFPDGTQGPEHPNPGNNLLVVYLYNKIGLVPMD